MRTRRIVFLFFFLGLLFIPAAAQFTSEEVAARGQWEEYLLTAKIVAEERPWTEKEAVTRPWLLTLEKDGKRCQAIWKKVKGRMRGFLEGWQWEIAAYRLDKHLDLNMVPPTVERLFKGDRGSMQLFVEHWIDYRAKVEGRIKTPSQKVFRWNRALYLQRAFDNLIANVDRHQRNYLITKDWRMVLIDHSRSFRTSRKYTRNLIYDEKFKEGPFLMKQLPVPFYEKIKQLDADTLQNIAGEYLTEKEIDSILKRRDLIVSWVENRCQKMGEDKVLSHD